MIKLYSPYVPPPGKSLKAPHEIHSASEITKYCGTFLLKLHSEIV